MSVKITKALANTLLADGIDSGLFVDAFTSWKAGCEYGNYLFGKDSTYINPKVNGKQYLLRHVHLVPLADASQLSQWNKAWKRKGRKTSDRALVYVSDNKGNHLLIYILSEPDAHAIATMKTAQHKEIMEGFAEVAAEFLESGEVLN